MNCLKYIALILTLFFFHTGFTQTKKDAKKQLDSIIHIATTTNRTTLDSLLNHLRTTNPSDNTFQIIQRKAPNGAVLQMLVVDGDTSYLYNMSTFNVVDIRPYDDKEKDKKFRRLRYHVKKVYPYALLASQKLRFYNEELLKVKSNSKRRKLLRMREKELKEEFADVIKKMSQTSGRVLVKLIDRETGSSSYEIIKEMRGGFKAFVYQGVGKLYGADLKVKYDPKNNEEDEMIERIVQMIIAEQQE
ncbi:MAG: DUF4294 domain-containing protein [Vicingus serpentipes]|nr:DUF4294 domain-containing protein [Vicingus serpentipes]